MTCKQGYKINLKDHLKFGYKYISLPISTCTLNIYKIISWNLRQVIGANNITVLHNNLRIKL